MTSEKSLNYSLGVSINAFMEFEIKTISDVLSLLIRMDEQTNMNISGEKDENGEYIPDSITIKFNDAKINEAPDFGIGISNNIANR